MADNRKAFDGPGDRKRLLLMCLGVCVMAAAIVAGLYAGGRRLETFAGTEEVRGDVTGRLKARRAIQYGEQQYYYRDSLTTVLLMGVDQPAGQAPPVGDHRNGGQADFLLLLAIDSKGETIHSIQIDRDTMAEIAILGVLGNPAGTQTAQICLSHGFGDGGGQSALFTVDAVRRHLLGIDIDFFIAMNLDGIALLNDMLGGVKVTLADDFTALDPTMRAGETIALQGKQAEYYVRSRMEIGDGTNESRMARQREYLNRAGAMIGEALRDNADFIGKLFDGLKKDLITNMTRGRMLNVAYASRNYHRTEMISPVGEHTVGEDGFVEFHADARALEKMVIEIFYEPVEAP